MVNTVTQFLTSNCCLCFFFFFCFLESLSKNHNLMSQHHKDGLVQERCNSSALAMELCLSYTNSLIRCWCHRWRCWCHRSSFYPFLSVECDTLSKEANMLYHGWLWIGCLRHKSTAHMIQWNLYKGNIEICGLSNQVVLHNRENKYDFVKNDPGKWRNLSALIRLLQSHWRTCFVIKQMQINPITWNANTRS